MRRRAAISTMAVGLVLLAMLAPFTAQPAPAAQATPLDLGAMTLQPGDLAGGDYGIWGGKAVDSDHVASLIAGNNNRATQQVAQRLRDAGWRYGYMAMLAVPDASNPSGLASLVEPQVAEFASRAGATKGFSILVTPQPAEGVTRHKPSTKIGDQTVITQYPGGAADSGEPTALVSVIFQRGNLIASLYVASYRADAKPTSDAMLIRLAHAFARRIDAVVNGTNVPGLSTRALHLTGDAVTTFYDNYDRIGGTTIPFAGEAKDVTGQRDATYDARKVTDAYEVIQSVGDTSAAGFGRYALYSQHFVRQADAERYIRGLNANSVTVPGTILRIAQVTDGPTFGDESQTFTYEYERSDKTKAAGYAVYLRTGRTAAAVQLDAMPKVSFATVRTVAAAQAACQTTGDCRKPLASPLMVSSNVATPAASPVATRATPTTSATPAASTAGKEPAAASVYRGNDAHTGVQPGPGPRGDLSLRWHWAPPDAPVAANDGQMMPPTLVDGVVYVGTGVIGGDYGGRIAAIDARTGRTRWIYTTPWFVATPVTVADGVAYAIGHDDTLYALNARTGKLIWKGSASAHSPPMVVNGIVYVSLAGTGGYGVRALDARTGKQIWSFDAVELIESAATVVDGVVYVGGSGYVSGTTYPGILYALDARTGKQIWAVKTAAPASGSGDVNTTPVVSGGMVYAATDDAVLYAIEAKTGKVAWTARNCATTPAVANGVVYCGGTSLTALNSRTGKRIWRFATDGRVSDPVVAAGEVYVVGYGELFVIEGTSGRRVTRFTGPVEPSIEVSPLVVDGMVYLNGRSSNSTGWLLAIGGR